MIEKFLLLGGRLRTPAALVLLTAWLPVAAPQAARSAPAQNPRLSLPRSQLGFDPASPAYLVGYIGTGGAFSNSNGQFGYGGAVVFHPDLAANFLDFLRSWNTGLVLQVDYQELYTHYRIRSGDFILRHYFGDVGPQGGGRSPYIGAGIGISEITFDGGEERGTEIGWAPLMSLGWETACGGRYLVDLRGQYRQYKRHGHDYIDWTLRLGLGLVLPW